MKIREICRVLAFMFSAGFIFGSGLYATLYKTWDIDLRISLIWGVIFIVLFWLGDHAKWTLAHKEKLRKEEVNKIIRDLNRETEQLKKKIPNLIVSGGEGSAILAGVYIDRIIELEKIKDKLMNDSVHQKARIEDYTVSNKLQK